MTEMAGEEPEEAGVVMVTTGAVVSDSAPGAVGTGIRIGLTLAWLVNAFRHTFVFGNIELRSVHVVPLLLTKLWPPEARARAEKPFNGYSSATG